ncbi:tyrosyl-DNA phosphodiesterase-domain-containing protein [Gaertneriomyces semiglobifer]|nr:tyrosyl-DNA phosphodiesterase-domain-containing protein [Gaertneriomyces semiglobifer]
MSAATWTCTSCTFINEKPHAVTCEICATARAGTVIDLTDEDDDSLQTALALSLSENPSAVNDIDNGTAGPSFFEENNVKREISPGEDPSPSPSSTTIAPEPSLSFSRAELERQRLARLAKKRPLESDAEDSSVLQSSKHARTSSSTIPSSSNKCWDGRVSLTYIRSHPKSNHVKFEDVVSKQGLTKAFFAASQIDQSWLMSHLPPTVKLVVAHSDRPRNLPPWETSLIVDKKTCLLFPPMSPEVSYGLMHIKLFILFYEDSIRVVIGSANLVGYDWEKLENVVWYQDFPLRSRLADAVVDVDNDELRDDDNGFLGQLISVLQEMGADQIIRSVRKGDFSKANASLILSRPGIHRSSKCGLPALPHVTRRLVKLPREKQKYEVTYVTGSLGRLNWGLVRDFVKGAVGDEILQAEKGKSKGKDNENDAGLRILFPTEKTVKKSTLGVQGAGTICFHPSNFTPSFPISILHDGISARRGTLMHAKMAVCLPKSTPTAAEIEVCDVKDADGWCYLGSHNMTAAAWGSRVREGWKIANWELGVVLPCRAIAQSIGTDEGKKIPVPWETPLKAYEAGDKPHMKAFEDL